LIIPLNKTGHLDAVGWGLESRRQHKNYNIVLGQIGHIITKRYKPDIKEIVIKSL